MKQYVEATDLLDLIADDFCVGCRAYKFEEDINCGDCIAGNDPSDANCVRGAYWDEITRACNDCNVIINSVISALDV